MSTESGEQTLQGVITKTLPGGWFQVRVSLGEPGAPIDPGLSYQVKAKLSGRMRKFRIRLVEGDLVDVNISSADLDKGVIEFRHNHRS